MKWKATSYSSGLKPTSRSTIPVFTSKLRNYYGRQGDALKLQCCVDGEPKPVVSWLKEGKPLMESENIKVGVQCNIFASSGLTYNFSKCKAWRYKTCNFTYNLYLTMKTRCS